MTKKSWLALAAILGGPFALSGCLIVAAGAATGVVVDEINESDGEFDPFEDVIDDIRDKEDGEDG